MSEQQKADELRGPACHTANLKEEVVKGIIRDQSSIQSLQNTLGARPAFVSNHSSVRRKQDGAMDALNESVRHAVCGHV